MKPSNANFADPFIFFSRSFDMVAQNEPQWKSKARAKKRK